MPYLKPADLAEFEERHPSAASWLAGRSLLREYEFLASRLDFTLSDWQRRRLAELQKRFTPSPESWNDHERFHLELASCDETRARASELGRCGECEKRAECYEENRS